MDANKLLKRIMLVFCVLILVPLLIAAVQGLRRVDSLYTRHPEKFQLVAEYFCAHEPDGFPLSVSRPSYGSSLSDEEWPQEVPDAVRYIFRHSSCDHIFASQTYAGVRYCEFHTHTSDSQQQFGIVYTPREDGHELLDEILYPPVSQWSALSDHWFRYTLVSYNDYNSCG